MRSLPGPPQLARTEDPGGSAWRIHPQLATLLRASNAKSGPEIGKRLTQWFRDRLPTRSDQATRQGEAWRQIQAEQSVLVDWLARLPNESVEDVVREGESYAVRNGPYGAWAPLFERGVELALSKSAHAGALSALADILSRTSESEQALVHAQDLLVLERGRQMPCGVADAAAVIADVYEDQGRYAAALQILESEVLPRRQ